MFLCRSQLLHIQRLSMSDALLSSFVSPVIDVLFLLTVQGQNYVHEAGELPQHAASFLKEWIWDLGRDLLFLFLVFSQMQFFFMLFRTDCSSLSMSTSHSTVRGVTDQLNGEWWERVPLILHDGRHRQDVWTFNLPLYHTVENTGVKMGREGEATLSTSLSKVCSQSMQHG